MNKKNAVLIDFGSTFTKVVAVSLEDKRIIFNSRFPSTVRSDARIGLSQCLDAAKQAMGKGTFQEAAKLASSSAAGGLRMAVLGLTKNLSITAGRNTAFGAGAKVLKTLSGRINAEDAQAITDAQVEMVLFCGGYEKGNTSIVLQNAEVLAGSSINVPVVYAGNSQIAEDVRKLFVLQGKECFIVKNIIPSVGELDTGGAEEIIRQLFMQRIVNMKGLDKVKSALDGVLMPTPAAVLSAGELLSKGWGSEEGIGPLMIVDIGGATTDIHSYAREAPFRGAKIIGAKEGYARRTVEGDLGMRESSDSLAEELGWDYLAKKCGAPVEQIKESINYRVKHTEYLAHTPMEKGIDGELARGAAHISARRHGGVLEHTHFMGPKLIQKGKNLTGVNYIVGTGGTIIYGEKPEYIMQGLLADREREQEILLPDKARFFLDEDYVLYAVGLLKEIHPETALTIVKNSIREI